MPYFQVTGTSAKGRQLSRKVNAETEEGAKRKAAQDGVVVATVVRVPSEPATDAQLSYARSLGIPIPNSPTVEKMSDLISRAVEPPASRWLVARAETLGADLDKSRHLGLGYVSRQLNDVLLHNPHAASVELAFWYLQSVLKHRLKATWSGPNDAGFENGRLFAIAEALLADEKASKSLRREYGNDPIYDYVEFGDGWGGKKSVRTAAYLAAVALLTRDGL